MFHLRAAINYKTSLRRQYPFLFSYGLPFYSISSQLRFYSKSNINYCKIINDMITNSPTYSLNTDNEVRQDIFNDVPGVKTQGEKYAMVYTCKVCSTRSVKKISKHSYHHGCVLVRCPGCQNLHLIADHIGIFEDKGWTIESYLSQHGENVKRVVNDGVLELTREDIIGSSKSSSS